MKKPCCRTCAYGVTLRVGKRGLPVCTNDVERPGQLTPVEGGGACRQYRPRYTRRRKRTPPPPCRDPRIRYVPLTQGKFAIVDARDYARVSQYNWCVSRKGSTIYAYRKDHGKNVYLHQFLMKPPPGKVVDHIDGNGLNDRRSNLRVVDRRLNQLNCRPSVRSSRFKGVRLSPWTRKWYAAITLDGHTIRLGPFDKEIEAARAYDRKAHELFGEYAYLNLPHERHEAGKKAKVKGHK